MFVCTVSTFTSFFVWGALTGLTLAAVLVALYHYFRK